MYCGHGNISTKIKTYQKNRANSFGRVSHVDGAIKADHLRHVGQGATVVQVEVTVCAGAETHKQTHMYKQTCHKLSIACKTSQVLFK